MRLRPLLAVSAVLLAGLLAAPPVSAATLCTLVADAATGQTMVSRGDCATRFTPASTFKIPLAVMAFDAGLLENQHAPVMTFREGLADWGGDLWKQPTDPARWMKFSVVWVSQVLAQSLGEARLRDTAAAFGYGNADFSGDAGKNNGLERAWIASSLLVSPIEQAAFLRRLVNRDLPVSRRAMEMTEASVEGFAVAGGWAVKGKTGLAYPRLADGTPDREHPWGWFVGWAVKDGRTLVFARLDQDEGRREGYASVRAREDFLKTLPELVGEGR